MPLFILIAPQLQCDTFIEFGDGSWRQS